MTHADRVREKRLEVLCAVRALNDRMGASVDADMLHGERSDEARIARRSMADALATVVVRDTELAEMEAATCPTCKGTGARPARPDFPYMTRCACDNGRVKEDK